MNAIGGSADFEAVRFSKGENFACLVALRRGRQPALASVIAGVEAALAGTGAIVELDPLHDELMSRPKGGAVQWLDRGTAFLLVNEVRVMIAWNAAGMPRQCWAGEYANPRLWPDAARDLERCRATAVITEMGIPGEDGLAAAFDRAVVVTLVAEAIWAQVPGIGLLWSPAGNALPAAMVKDAFGTVRGGRAALSLWMRWREIAPPAGLGLCPGLVTSGLMPILGREIEAAPSTVPSAEMLQHIIHLASGLIDHQAAIDDGHVLARRADRPIMLQLRDRGLRDDVPIYALTMDYEAA